MLDWLRSLFGKSDRPSSEPDAARALFMAEAEEILRALPQVETVTRNEEAFALDIETTAGGSERAFLDNHFLETREMSPDERRARMIRAFSTVGKRDVPSWEEAKAQILPVLRGATFGIVGAAQFPGAKESSRPVKRAFAPCVDAMIVLDRPTDMLYVSAHTVEEWKMSLDEVYDAALANFCERAPLEAELYDELHGPLFHVASGDSYEASRLLVPGWLASFRGKVEGDPIAIVPQREMLFVGGSARPEMVERLAEMAAKEFESSPRRISSALYTVDADDEIVPYRSSSNAVILGHAKVAMHEYNLQQETLRQSGEWDDWFVATYSVYVMRDGEVIETAVWTNKLDTLLPKVPFVGLVIIDDDDKPVGKPVLVAWNEIADRLTLVPAVHPPRWKTGEFPTGARYDELVSRAKAV